MPTIQGTIVFEKNWEAIHARNPDGSRKYRYILNRGSSRSSKTFSLIDLFDLYGRSEKNKRLTAWRDTKTDCKKTVLNDVLKRLKSTSRWMNGMDFNKTESIITYASGSTFEIHGTDDAETVHGLTQDAAWLNEPYAISKDTFDQIDQRTADFILLDLNPKQGHWSDDLEKDPRCLVIHSTYKDNPFCPEESKNKIESYQPVIASEACLLVMSANKYSQDAAANYLRTYDIVKNELKFNDTVLIELRRGLDNEYKNTANLFNWQVYGLGLKAERPNRIFKWAEIPDQTYHDLKVPIYTASDWGTVDPWAILDAKYYDGGLYLHQRNYRSENEWRSKLTPTEWAQVTAADEGLVKWLFGKLGVPFNRTIACDTNRPLKIKALRAAGWDYAVTANKPKGSIADGISILENLRVYFTASSTDLKYEQENYSRKVDAYGKILEEPEDIDNHLIDCARYIALLLEKLGVIKKV